MRLIDADNLQLNLMVPSKNNAIVKAFENSVIDALNKQPTVKAIPVEWIRNYVSIWISELYKNFALNMINVWEKENE